MRTSRGAQRKRSLRQRRNALAISVPYVLVCLMLLGLGAIVYFASPTATSTTSTQHTGSTPTSYSGTPYIDRRDYAVVIGRNGDVAIDEHWVMRIDALPYLSTLSISWAQTTGVEFESGVGSGIKFSHLNVMPASSTSPASSSLTWYFAKASSQGLRTYTFDIYYTLHGALGLNRTRAWLDWQFLDTAGVPGKLSSCTISIALPMPVSPGTIQAAATDPDAHPTTDVVDGAGMVSSATSLNPINPFEVEISFPRSLLSPMLRRPVWQHGDTPPILPTALIFPRANWLFQDDSVGYPTDPIQHPPSPFLIAVLLSCCLAILILVVVVPTVGWGLEYHMQRRAIERRLRSRTPDSS